MDNTAIPNDRPLRDILARKPKVRGEGDARRDLSTNNAQTSGV
ncbi:hypothetical protein [Streptomyces yunnanensis]|nr:hypothetical protein [Streptomyces yunnanensis]